MGIARPNVANLPVLDAILAYSCRSKRYYLKSNRARNVSLLRSPKFGLDVVWCSWRAHEHLRYGTYKKSERQCSVCNFAAVGAIFSYAQESGPLYICADCWVNPLDLMWLAEGLDEAQIMGLWLSEKY
jgi:hypothetical protein